MYIRATMSQEKSSPGRSSEERSREGGSPEGHSAEGQRSPEPERVAGRSKLREYVEALLVALIFLKFANAFVLQTFYIPSSSMEETLLVGDHLFVNRFIYGPGGALGNPFWLPARAVRRGDVVIFRSKENPAEDIVKRCIGLPGDRLEMVAKQLYLNGERLDESEYVVFSQPLHPRRDNFAPLTVPEGHYFCFGDNRDNSNDSRFWGALPAHLVKGRASAIYWSYEGASDHGNYRGLLSTVGENGPGLGNRLLGIVKLPIHFFADTRWGRTALLIR